MRIHLMVEGQNGVSWPQWVALAQACEENGLAGLHRSDHLMHLSGGRQQAALEAWSTLAALGPMTSTIRLGTLVSPTSFRHPAILARQVVTADHTSGGRVELGIGAGWNEPEHDSHGLPFRPTRARMDVLEEQLALVVGFLGEDGWDHDGAEYRVRDAHAWPKPVHGSVPITLGGAAGPRASRLAATWAAEYNLVYATVEEIAERGARLDAACAAAGRDPSTLRRSLMTSVVTGASATDVDARVGVLADAAGVTVEDYRAAQSGRAIIGTVDEVGSRLEQLAALDIERLYCQQLDHTDLEHVALLASLA